MDTVGMSSPFPQQFHSTNPHVPMSGISWIPFSTSIIEVMDENLCSQSTGSAPWGRIPLRTRIKLWMCWRKHKNKIQFILGRCRTVYSGEILNWENPRCKISSSEVIVAVQKMGFWHRFLQEGAASTTGSRQEVLEQTSVKDI